MKLLSGLLIPSLGVCDQLDCRLGIFNSFFLLSRALFFAASRDQSHVKHAVPASLNPIPHVPVLREKWAIWAHL